MQTTGTLRIRDGLVETYPDALPPAALDALNALARFDDRRRALMRARIDRRARRFRARERLAFLPPEATIGGTNLTAADARAGRFDGSDIPQDLQRQWIQ